MSGAASRGVVYHIDASYFVFRAYYSLPPDMADADGNSTHALYGFARFLADLLEQVRPERICVAFDHSLGSETSLPRSALTLAGSIRAVKPPKLVIVPAAEKLDQSPLAHGMSQAHQGVAGPQPHV